MLELRNIDLTTDPVAAGYVKTEIVTVTFAQQEGELASLEGPNRYQVGDALITGSTGSRWSVSRHRFDAKYEAVLTCSPPTVAGEDGRYRARPIPILAKQISEPFTAARSPGGDVLLGSQGDWLLQYGPADFGIGEHRRFMQVYKKISSHNSKGHAMHPIHDVDVLVLMATTLSSKRRPAELVEIVAAADLIQGSIPFVEKLGDAIQRLSTFGLISATEGGFTLTPIGHEIMAKQPKKAVTEELIIAIKSNLATYNPIEEYPPILLTQEQLSAAIRAYKTTRKAPGKNLLMPQPKVDRHFKVEGRWRRVPATRSGKP